MITKSEREWIESYLKKIDFVQWDRFIPKLGGQSVIGVYGWINREKDSYKDFVYLEFSLEARKVFHIADSSFLFTKKIGSLCDDIGNETHINCVRVEKEFNIKNCIMDKKKK